MARRAVAISQVCADGIMGGGTHNYVRCTLGFFSGDTERSALQAQRDAVGKKITGCLAPAGWTGGKNETVPGGGRLQIERMTFKPASGAADIVIESEGRVMRTRAGPASMNWTAELLIRTPTLWAPPPKPAG